MGSRFGSVEQGCYVAILPFVLAPRAKIDSQEGTITTSDGSFTYKLKKHTDVYTLSLETFDSTDIAATHLDKLRAILLWLSLTRRVGLSYAKSRGEVRLYNVPITDLQHGPLSHIASFHDWNRINGDYDLNVEEAMILPQDKNILRTQGFAPSVTVGLSSEDFSKAINEALAFAQPEGVVADDKLKLASEIYAGYRFESSGNMKFLSLVTALESLLPDDIKISDYLQKVIKDIKEFFEKRTLGDNYYEKDSPQIKRMLSRIENLKKESIRYSIEIYMSSVMEKHPEIIEKHPELGNHDEIIRNLKCAYDVRSRLVHDGKVSWDKKLKSKCPPRCDAEVGQEKPRSPLDKSFSFLSEFMPFLLEALYREKASPNA